MTRKTDAETTAAAATPTVTVDVRLLLTRGGDAEYLVEQLVTRTAGAGAPLGAVVLETGELDHLLRQPPRDARIHTRPGVEWDGAWGTGLRS